MEINGQIAEILIKKAKNGWTVTIESKEGHRYYEEQYVFEDNESLVEALNAVLPF